jgi:hypothetical protein
MGNDTGSQTKCQNGVVKLRKNHFFLAKVVAKLKECRENRPAKNAFQGLAIP